MDSVVKYSTVPAIARALLAVVAMFAAATGNAQSARPDVTRLLEATGFDDLLRVDASRDEKLMELSPSFLPPGLRSDMARAVDESMGYAGMRRAMAEALAARLDSAAVDQQLRWWASPPGKSVSAAQLAAFRVLTETASETTGRPTAAVAQGVPDESPFAVPLLKLAQVSRRTNECLGLSLAFRRICADTSGTPIAAAAEAQRAQYAKLPAGDDAAFRAYLKTPGARETVGILADAYLRTRTARYAETQRAIEGALARFARKEIGGKPEADAMLPALIARIDEDSSFEEVSLMLHLLRSLSPSDPRVLVELSRVSMKRGVLNRWNVVGQPPGIDPGYLEDAQSWMDSAIALDPKRADTLVLAGYLAYVKLDFDKSISLLEQARSIGTNNPWLAINLADALWAKAQSKHGDRVLLGRAAQEFSAALVKPLTDDMRLHANSALSSIYSELRDVAKARAQYQRWIAESNGAAKVRANHEYSRFLFFYTDDLDGSIAAARQVSALGGIDQSESFLAQVLLVKAAKLYANNQAADAAKLVKQARLAVPGIERAYARLAFLPKTLPGVFALLGSGLVGDLSGSEGGLVLVYASRYASAADVERLIRVRANPNYLSPEAGTPLAGAIVGRNLPAVKVLLAHGADMSLRNRDGLLPLEYAEMIMRRTNPNDAQILATMRTAVKGTPSAEPVGAPLKAGYIYEVLRRFSSERNSNSLEVGARVTFSHNCNVTDSNVACLDFRHPTVPGVLLDIQMEKAELVSWQEWFKEIGPAPAPAK
jgi:hypothetical protein